MSKYSEFYDLMESWTTDIRGSRQAINCIVEFLADDVYWLKQNISVVDIEFLKQLVTKLHGEAK